MYKVLTIAYVLSWVTAIASIGAATYHFSKMVREMRGDRGTLANLSGPLVLFLSAFYTDKGNYHRARFWLWLLLGVSCLGLLAVIDAYMPAKK